jgi:DNA polymerase-3 subunit delta'
MSGGGLDKFERVAGFLARVAANPPKSILLEGGDASGRMAMAMHWAMLLNCDPGAEAGGPCRACGPCQTIASGAHRDVIILDGREGAIKIAAVREVRRLMGEPPRGEGTRIIILSEAQALGEEAANCLLKSMEEPRPGNVFVLTTPQRERLLPTLVSRSFVFTLPWPRRNEIAPPDPGEGDEEPSGSSAAELAAGMRRFWESGRGWFELTGGKGDVTQGLGEELVSLLQRDLAGAFAGEESEEAAFLVRRLDTQGLRRLDVLLEQAREALEFRTNTMLVLDWVAVTVHSWFSR